MRTENKMVKSPVTLQALRCLAALLWLSLSNARGMESPSFSVTANETRQAPLTATFTAHGPADLRTVWTFGDGSSAQGQQVQHTFYRPGQYQIQASGYRGSALIWQGSGIFSVASAGPEQAALTLLIGRGQVTLSSLGSVIYQPAQASFNVNGQQVSPTFTLRPGHYQLTIHLARLTHTISLNYRNLDGNAAFEQRVLELTNQARASGWDCAAQRGGAAALPSLKWNSTLARAALAQSAAMALYGYFAHESPVDQSTPLRRVQATGLQPRSVGENIARNQQTPAEVVQDWLRSPGHCRNIMGDFTDLGVSYVLLEGQTYWTQEFGK